MAFGGIILVLFIVGGMISIPINLFYNGHILGGTIATIVVSSAGLLILGIFLREYFNI
jgi:hypothetical protein